MDTATKIRSKEETQKKFKEMEAIYEKMLAEAGEIEKKKKEIIEKYVGKLERKKAENIRSLIQDKS